jgi:hypothetical protein
MTITQLINIDSRYRDKKYKNSGNFIQKLENQIKNVLSIRVATIEFPNIYYIFCKNRDNLSFSINVADIKLSILIREGNYTVDNIIDEITHIFDQYNTTYGLSLYISYDQITSKCTITNSSPFTANFENVGKYDGLGKHLGFLNKQYTSINNTMISESIVNVVGDAYFYLSVNDYGNMFNNVYSNNLIATGILAKIIIKKNKGEYIYDNESNLLSKSYTFDPVTNIQYLKIELFDYLGNTLDLMGNDFSMTLEIIRSNNQF